MSLNTPSPLSLWSAPRRKVGRPILPNPFFAKNSCLDRESITVSTSPRAPDRFCHILITMSASNWVLWNRILLTTVIVTIGPGWFRLEGSAGIRMPTSCQPINRCGTHIANWINGGHPSIADGQVSRTVCFHWTSGCYQWSAIINAKWEIVVLIMCTILIANLLVMAIIVVLIKKKKSRKESITCPL